MKGEHMTEDGRGVRYDDLKKSATFRQIEELAVGLRNVDLKILDEPNKMAFFISILHGCTIV